MSYSTAVRAGNPAASQPRSFTICYTALVLLMLGPRASLPNVMRGLSGASVSKCSLVIGALGPPGC